MKPLLTASKITLYLEEFISLFDMVDGVKTIGDFVKRVESLSLAHKFVSNSAQPTQAELDHINAFKGDALEVLAEIFFRILAADPAVGITDYQPVPLAEDYGVDAVGTNVNGDRCVVQVKYRVNPLELIEWNDLGKTDSQGLRKYNVLKEKSHTVFLFTTGKDATPPCYESLGSALRVIDRSIISSYVDNNQTFWEQAQEMILFTLDNL